MIKEKFNRYEYVFGFLANILRMKTSFPESFSINNLIADSSFDDHFSSVGELYHCLEDGKMVIWNHSKENTLKMQSTIIDVCKYFFMQHEGNPKCDVDKLIEEKSEKFMKAVEEILKFDELLRENLINFVDVE